MIYNGRESKLTDYARSNSLAAIRVTMIKKKENTKHTSFVKSKFLGPATAIDGSSVFPCT